MFTSIEVLDMLFCQRDLDWDGKVFWFELPRDGRKRRFGEAGVQIPLEETRTLKRRNAG